MSGVRFFVPLDVATAPAEGHCYVNRWWTIHPEKGVAFYAQLLGYGASEVPAPQCNGDEFTAKTLAKRAHADCEVRLLPAVYEGPALKEMLRLRGEARKQRDSGKAA